MKTILGINHQFLYPDAIVDTAAHTNSLKELSSFDNIDALDCWLWRGERAKEEAEILKASEKIINYNIGDRFGEDICRPAAASASERDHAYSTIMREIEYALMLGSKKIVFGSGPDVPNDRDGAQERFFEFVMKILGELPKDVTLALEPTDRNIDKYFLYGPLDETIALTKKIRAEGYGNFGILLDMCHVPIIHETLDSALKKAKDSLVHIHLGNCMIKDKTDALYGDKHPAWGYPGGEYAEAEAVQFLKALKAMGYTDKPKNTITFEMRRIDGLGAKESLSEFIRIYKKSMN
ncbi:MAG: sugar phosphate isomerase/epimerase [Clostridia bacterium]|nr:sugar phosphate isomerase/epimerase [Clostridia bacterium]